MVSHGVVAADVNVWPDEATPVTATVHTLSVADGCAVPSVIVTSYTPAESCVAAWVAMVVVPVPGVVKLEVNVTAPVNGFPN